MKNTLRRRLLILFWAATLAGTGGVDPFFHAVAVALNGDEIAVVDEAVKNRRCQDRVEKDI